MSVSNAAVHRWRSLGICALLAILLAGFPGGVPRAQAISTTIVISQIYGGGGNASAPYNSDFIELFNLGTTTVSLAGWSVQYTSATGTGNFGSAANLITPLDGSLAPGQYLLVQEAGGATGAALPTPDVTDATPINMSSTGGKVALVNTTTPLGCNGSSTACSPAALATIVDLIGYDGANFFEGTPAPTLSNTTAALRASNGCLDSDNNSADFSAVAPSPRNTATALSPCPTGDVAPTVLSTTPTSGATNVAVDANIIINFSEPVAVTGSAFTLECPAGTPIAFSNTTGSGPATGFTLDPASDLPTSTTCSLTVVASQVSDADAADPPDTMAADFSFSFTTAAPATASPLVINEIDYDQPGTDTAEFIEIKNNDSVAVNLDAYSLQLVNGSGGAIYRTIDLPSVSLAAGDYYVVCANNANVANCDLDVTPDTDLIQNGAPDAVALLFNTTIIDAVSYEGDTIAPYTEGSGAGLVDTAAAANESISRCPDGADTNQNNVDFSLHLGTPGATNICVAVDPAPTVSSTSPASGAAGVAPTTNIDITFSEPVNVTGSWFSISCATSGAHSATASGGPTTFTLNPDVDFVASETCSVTVVAAQVSDQDTNDPFDTMAANFSFSFTTGALQACGDAYTPIYTIQGSGLNAAITGNVATEGVVVGDFEGSSGLGGFYLQDPAGDGDTATSDGIFVFTGSANAVSAGQRVRVTGFARERFSQTSINGANSDNAAVTNILDCGPGGLPAAVDVTMPFPNANYPERFEGMRVNFPQTLTIAEYFNYARFGEIVLAYAGGIAELAGHDRLYTPTSIVAPGAPANALAAQYELRQITLDDGLSTQNPGTLRHPNGDPFSLSNRFRGGDTLQNVVGVLGFDFSVYRIQPTAPATYTAANPRPAAPEDVGGRIRVGTFNTLNYFLTADGIDDDSGPDNPADNICGGNANLECRGADASQPTEFGRQRAKLLQAIIGLNADALGLNELENTPNVEPLADIVAGLNAILGPGTYDYIHTGTIGTDAIKVGMIYKPAVLNPVGSFAILNSSVDPRFIDTKSRPSLAQTFEEVGTGARFTLAVNHLKSKGSDCVDVGDPDAGDGQGNCNGTRKAAAQALVDWLATDPTGSGDPDFLVLGDMNSYAKEDPISAIRAGADDALGTNDDWTNLIAAHQGAFAYSYVFDAQLGYLDHALANASILSQVTGAADWHINADEPSIFDYDTTFKPAAQEALYEPNAYRTSDHDPVVVGLNLTVPNRAPVANDDSYSIAEDGTLDVAAPGVLGNDDDDDGDTLTAQLVDGPSHGALALNSDGSFTYTPAANYNGPDSFTYKANDSAADSNVASVSITVTPVNDAPTAAVAAGAQCLADFRGLANLSVGDIESTPGSLTLSGSSSNTTLVPNANITFSGSSANRTVTIATAAGKSGSAIVTITISDGADTTSITIQVLAGTNNNDTLNGGSGADMIFAGNAQDTLNGNSGNDLLCGGQGDDTLNGGDGDDTFNGGSGQDQLSGEAGADTLNGEQGDDTLNGGDGDDTLNGGDGDDTLNGGDGDDTLNGDRGDDQLTGGTGADAFDGGPNNDTATDFNAVQGDTKINIP